MFIKTNKGFTMLELIMVVVVIATLISLVLPGYRNMVEKARAAEAVTYIGVIKKALIAQGVTDWQGGGICYGWWWTLAELGLSDETTYFYYGTGGITPEGSPGYSFQVTSIRKDPPYGYIRLFYEVATGAFDWVGDDIGTPGGPTH